MRVKPQVLENLRLEDAASDGRCVARTDDRRVVFVEGGAPGDLADVRVLSKQRKHFVGKIERLIEPSPARVTPPCQHFDSCGGCVWQHMDYDAQLRFKHKQVADAIARIGGLDAPILEILPAPEIFGYRNKLEFSALEGRWLTEAELASGESFDRRAVGFHAPGRYDRVVPVEECLLMPEPVNEIRNFIRDYALRHDWTFYHPRDHRGFLRGLLFRKSGSTDDFMLNVIVAEPDAPRVAGLLVQVAARFPQITSLVCMHNPKTNDSYGDLAWTSLKGPDYITECLGRYVFRVSPVSFFQTNTKQAERLYQLVYDALPERTPLLYDLYCGAGSIGIFVSDKADKIVGVEYVPQAVEDARLNAEANGLTHLDFHAGDMAALLNDDFFKSHGRPDVVITDPPRAGMEPRVVEALLRAAPARIVYVSCNPAALARDAAKLAPDYELRSVQPVDMFPHTAHVEAVAILDRRG